ncbi:uncharacterized protein [Aristolochia californica]|uniref:uncharacterized protein n=1 Tax=Aristolochia californica TaxID=171875 RepID=UPI0035D9CC1B
MLPALRLLCFQSNTLLLSPAKSAVCRRKSAFISLRLTKALSTQSSDETDQDMDPNQPQAKKDGDVMTQSFGEAYATRCDEEGFGGIYARYENLEEERVEKANMSRQKHREDYDQSQGVKEKERGRNEPEDVVTP